MQTATQCKTVEPYMSSILVRREPKHTLLTREQKMNPNLMGLSCLVMDGCFIDCAYQNKRGCS